MGKYDFGKPVDRMGTGSIKWNVAEGELPMWVADMDFMTAPEIIEALKERVSHGMFGYTDVNDEWRDAYINWWGRRHGLKIDRDELIFCTGVIPAISSIVRKLTTPNENVIIQTPVYNVFFNCILNNGCRVLENQLIYSGGAYSVDFEDLEKKMSDPQTTLMILCNPHNPVGKIWDRETLAKIGELALENHVTVISDEIHCDIVKPGCSYVPFASVSETCRRVSITCFAPTKTFSIPGVQTAAVFVSDPVLRHKVWRGINTDEVGEPSVFAVTAAIAAFTKGGDWVSEMCEYVFDNRMIVSEYIRNNIPGVKLIEGDATYLLWLDLTSLGVDSKTAYKIIREKTGLFLSVGSAYGKCGDGFLRMNVACPRSFLEDGLERLKRGIEEIKKEVNENG